MSTPEHLLQVGDDVPSQTLVNVQGSKWCIIAEHGKVIWAGHYTEMVKLIREAAKNAAR